MHRSKKYRYSITSLADACNVGGTMTPEDRQVSQL
jgi:hypothetical protein